jgi:hypothetical protein
MAVAQSAQLLTGLTQAAHRRQTRTVAVLSKEERLAPVADQNPCAPDGSFAIVFTTILLIEMISESVSFPIREVLPCAESHGLSLTRLDRYHSVIRAPPAQSTTGVCA